MAQWVKRVAPGSEDVPSGETGYEKVRLGFFSLGVKIMAEVTLSGIEILPGTEFIIEG